MNKIIKIFSYVIDFPIEKRISEYSGEVKVSLHKGQYKLSTKKAIYSFGKNYTSFDVAFKSSDVLNQKIQSVLVLGIGLGSVVDLLENNSSINEITAVDADSVIIDLAKKYLQSTLRKNTYFICDDAEKFVYNTQQKFDLILFDVFIEDETPMQFMQTNFLKEIKKIINKNGILLFSKIDETNNSKIENAQFEKTFTAIFQDSFSINTNGNKVFAWINSNP